MFKNLPRLQEETAADPGASAAPAAPASVLAAAAPAADPSQAWPEKFRTVGEDGSFDLTTTATKTLEAYKSLEQRFGTGDVPPKSADEYALAGLPETVSVADLKADPAMQSFLKGAHAKGMTDAQVAFAINEHARLVKEGGLGGQMTAEKAQEQLSQLWTDDKTYEQNITHSFRAAETMGKKAGVSMAEIEASGLGNNPVFIRIMAALGPELGEDTTTPTAPSVEETQSIQSLMNSPAYMDSKHADHAQAVAKVKAYYDKKYAGTTAF